ncbi:MAG: hypothetical protein LBI17_01565 [Rickettsiales bacterium]|jgi:hypothetical protein|nr:hypothetical protein [Rickettsiales bacterium]
MKRFFICLTAASMASAAANAQESRAAFGNPDVPATLAAPARTAYQPQMEITSDYGLKSDYSAAANAGGGRDDGSFSMQGFQIGAGAGLFGGLNVGIGYRIPYSPDNFWKNRFGFRVEYNSSKLLDSLLDDIEVDGEKFTPHVDGKQFGALIDFYPFSYTWFLGGFRLSGGYYTGDFALGGTLHKEASGIFSMKNSAGVEQYYQVDAAADLMAELAYDKIRGPYVGAGFDLGLFWGLKFYFDAGLVFTDKSAIKAELSAAPTSQIKFCLADSTCASGASYSINSTTVDALLADTVREYEDELSELKKDYFPIVKLGLMYRF